MGFAIFLNYCRDSLKSGGTQDSYTAAMKFCAVVFLVYLAIGADASKRKKVCKQIMGKFPYLEDLIIKKQNCCTVGNFKKIVSVVYIKSSSWLSGCPTGWNFSWLKIDR